MRRVPDRCPPEDVGARAAERRSVSAVSADIAVHGGRRSPGPLTRSDVEPAERVERPIARLITFSAFALYGVLRWATLEKPAPSTRLFGLFALAVVLVGAGPKLDRRSRPLAIAAAVCALFVMPMICGIPFGWLIHLRFAAIGDGIRQGLGALPDSLMPYLGVNAWVRLVMVLGAGVLMLDAALLLAFSGQQIGDLRRAASATALIALAVIPSTIVRPQLPYVQGLILFALLVAFMWSERAAAPASAGAIALAAVAGVCGVVLAPGLDQRQPWLNYNGLTRSLAPTHVDSFDWSQRYGPLNWPQGGREVLDIKARNPDYWKAENLDAFNGTGFARGPGLLGSQIPTPPASELRRFTQTVQVTLRSMRTSDVIAAGFASSPGRVGEGVSPGVSPGTWTANTALGPGDSYTVSVYSPHPTGAELAAAGAEYPPRAVADELTIGLPTSGLTVAGLPQVGFPPFHSSAPIANVIGPYNLSGLELVRESPYLRAYQLAQRLASAAPTPHAFVQSVERYLSPENGFAYDQRPSPATYPLESFLFSTRRGYCQQFAGAMALLLRMGGVPARVATGFTTGNYDSSKHQYVVSDLDAHAWVEAYFPNYGWVRFDPTPAAAPARRGRTSLLPAAGLNGNNALGPAPGIRRAGQAATTGAAATHHGAAGGLPLGLIVGLLAAALVAAASAIALLRPGSPPSAERLVRELDRAFDRCGRPLHGGATLRGLERRFRASAAAARYVRTLRLARFAGTAQLPSGSDRRAVRAELAAGLGAAGRLRALWALPPRPWFGRHFSGHEGPSRPRFGPRVRRR
jgi:transglutaminase-like putative cysteine protease